MVGFWREGWIRRLAWLGLAVGDDGFLFLRCLFTTTSGSGSYAPSVPCVAYGVVGEAAVGQSWPRKEGQACQDLGNHILVLKGTSRRRFSVGESLGEW